MHVLDCVFRTNLGYGDKEEKPAQFLKLRSGSDRWIVNSALFPSRLDAEFKKGTEDIIEVKPDILVEFTRNYQASCLLERLTEIWQHDYESYVSASPFNHPVISVYFQSYSKIYFTIVFDA